jgi:hypothetical protein
MSDLDDKINEHFAGFVVRKDLVKAVKGNAIVPTYWNICSANTAPPMTRPRFRPASRP